MQIAEMIDDWVQKELEDFKPENLRADKVIRDAALDTHKFFQHEINILDLPILQRLRRISQTSFAYLIYPSATHSRFEHTLGVTIIASKFAQSIKEKDSTLMSKSQVFELRLAGILHDIGHGPLSHSSESIYKNLIDVKKEVRENPKFSKCEPKPHEMLSYYIVTSKSFREYFEKLWKLKDYPSDINLDNVANMIVGNITDPEKAYESDIINGAFDADKLDYIARDCYFTGLKMQVDLDRIMYTISIDKKMKFPGRKGLMIDISGAPYVEQVLFNKILLYSSLYHHHKVRTLECMFKSIFEVVNEKGLSMNGYSFKKVTDFLSLTDHEVLSLEGKPKEIKILIKNILNRALLKRALVISRSTLINDKTDDEININYQNFLKSNTEDLHNLRELIVNEVNDLPIYDLWIDLPDFPSFKEASTTPIRVTDDDVITLDEIFPINKWLNSYAQIKWKGHIFCPPEKRSEVNEASIKIFRDEFGIEFNKFATSLAKFP